MHTESRFIDERDGSIIVVKAHDESPTTLHRVRPDGSTEQFPRVGLKPSKDISSTPVQEN